MLLVFLDLFVQPFQLSVQFIDRGLMPGMELFGSWTHLWLHVFHVGQLAQLSFRLCHGSLLLLEYLFVALVELLALPALSLLSFFALFP